MQTSSCLLSLFVALLLAPALAQAEEYTPLPFSVSIGGRAAQVKGNAAEATFATIESPVAANAPVEVGAKGDMTIVNVVTATEKGAPVEGASPVVMLIQGGNKTTLDKTMDGKKFSPGNYLMAFVADGKTATVFVKIR